MNVRDWGALFEAIERMACENGFTYTTGSADQGIMWGRFAQRRLKRTGGFSYLCLTVHRFPLELDVFENLGINDLDD